MSKALQGERPESRDEAIPAGPLVGGDSAVGDAAQSLEAPTAGSKLAGLQQGPSK